MKNNKKIGGFKTKLFNVLQKDEQRQDLMYAKIKNGYVYASNGRILLKQNLQTFHEIDKEQADLIEGKTFHRDLLKQLWAFDVVEFKEHTICASSGGAYTEFDYSHKITSPNFEAVLLYSFNETKALSLDYKLLKTLCDAMDFDGFPYFYFAGENKAVTVCNGINQLDIQHGLIMPATIES
jgi:hypothetical protein